MDDSGFQSFQFSPRMPVQPLSLLEIPPTMQSLPPTIHGPLTQAGFVPTTESLAVEKLMTDPNVKAVVVSGPPGSGKSFLAREMCAKVWQGKIKEEPKIYRFLNCEHLNTLYNDLHLFYGDLNLKQDSLMRVNTWQIIQTLYDNMETQFPSYYKVFVLDDVEKITELLEVLNTICGESSKLWKFIVTTQKIVLQPEAFKSLFSENNFRRLEGFSKKEAETLFQYSDIDEPTLQKLLDGLGTLPLALTICMRSLGSDEMECDRSEFVDDYLTEIKTETELLPERLRNDRSASVLIAIKISIDRLIEELPHPELSRELIKLISLFSDKNSSTELLYACAETVTPDPAKAKQLAQQLTSRMVERSICDKKSEDNIRLFSLHKLVKQSMQLFLEKDEKVKLIQSALIALTAVMPKDGRKHQDRFNGIYAEHGESLIHEILQLAPNISCETTPVICFLHCKLLVGIGYCMASKTSSAKSGCKKLEQARDDYCELVFGRGWKYQQLVDEEKRRRPDSEVHKEVAKKLYAEGQKLLLIESKEYMDYVGTLTRCHRLTKKDLKNMGMEVKEKQLVNGHLTEQQLQIFVRNGKDQGEVRVIPTDKLARIAIAELLAEIFAVWSRKSEDEEMGERMGEAAVTVYNKVYEDFNVYLLDAVITERDLLTLKERRATRAEDIESISIQLEELSRVGQVEGKRLAFEAGLMRSDMSKDHYHELLCLESKLECQGRLYEFGDEVARTNIYNEGTKRMLGRIEELAGKQIYQSSALSHSYRHFGRFLSHCQRYDEAAVYIIKAMVQLHEYKVGVETKSPGGAPDVLNFPEFETNRFDNLYRKLCDYYVKFTSPRRDDKKLLTAHSPEATYLQKAMAVWNQASGENNSTSSNDSSSKYDVLEQITEIEIQGESVTATEEVG